MATTRKPNTPVGPDFLKGAATAAAALVKGKRKGQRDQALSLVLRRIQNRGITKTDFIAAVESVEKTAARGRL